MSLEITEMSQVGVSFWHSPQWTARGITHGFFGRGFNATGAKHLASATELAEICGALPLALLKQVHGTEILLENTFDERPLGDGWLIDVSPRRVASHLAFAVQTADCFPVFILDPVREECALLHAGWRGVVGGIVPRAVSLLCSRGSDAENLELLIGPAAQSCCYEVGEDVLAELRAWEKKLSGSFSLVKGGENFARLRELILAQVKSMGVSEYRAGELLLCTICDERFFSYRREKALAGRQVSLVVGSVAYNKSV